MTPQKQLISHNPDEGRWGDCYRTCIACLLDLPPCMVPNFCAEPEPDMRSREWLKSRGYNIVKVCMAESHAHAAVDWFDDVPYILTGQSPNIEGVAHCVIGKGAFEVLWDVSPGNNGLAGPWVDENGNRVYWAEFIVPLIKVAADIESGINRNLPLTK